MNGFSVTLSGIYFRVERSHKSLDKNIQMQMKVFIPKCDIYPFFFFLFFCGIYVKQGLSTLRCISCNFYKRDKK